MFTFILLNISKFSFWRQTYTTTTVVYARAPTWEPDCAHRRMGFVPNNLPSTQLAYSRSGCAIFFMPALFFKWVAKMATLLCKRKKKAFSPCRHMNLPQWRRLPHLIYIHSLGRDGHSSQYQHCNCYRRARLRLSSSHCLTFCRLPILCRRVRPRPALSSSGALLPARWATQGKPQVLPYFYSSSSLYFYVLKKTHS